jgi:hypothetical protein
MPDQRPDWARTPEAGAVEPPGGLGAAIAEVDGARNRAMATPTRLDARVIGGAY